LGHDDKQVHRRRYESRCSVLAEAETACTRKTKICFLERAYLFRCRNSMKKMLTNAKFHWKLVMLSYSKNEFHCGVFPPSKILKMFIFGYLAVIKFQMCCGVPDFIKIGCFLEIWRFNHLQYGGCTPCWSFEVWS